MRRWRLALGAAALIALAVVAMLFIAPRSHMLFPPRASNGTEYVLYVSVPESCRREPCTALYLLDGERWLPTFARAADQGLLEPVIIVGIGYRDILGTSRRRKFDFTPAFGRQVRRTGGADEYLRVLREEIIPYAEAHLPIAPDEHAIAGHSYGGLLATYALAQAPDLFDRYLIISPALWFDDGKIYAVDFSRNADHASVFLSADTPETGSRSDMARDVDRLATVLSNQTGALITGAVFEGENHDSVVAPSARNGLSILYGRSS